MIMTALWGLGYAALVVAAFALGRYIWRAERGAVIAGQLSMAAGVLLLGAGVLIRSLRGHGWPLVSWQDTATGIALLALCFYLVWSLLAREYGAGLIIAVIALFLLAFGLAQQIKAPVTTPWRPIDAKMSMFFSMCGGAFLALAASIGVGGLGQSLLGARFGNWPWPSSKSQTHTSEAFVRWALFFLAAGLAIDVWWVQKLDLGMADNAQQAGIAISWMIYFIAVRFHSHPRWRGWPWSAILVVGFICVLPILLNVSWLEKPFPI